MREEVPLSRHSCKELGKQAQPTDRSEIFSNLFCHLWTHLQKKGATHWLQRYAASSPFIPKNTVWTRAQPQHNLCSQVFQDRETPGLEVMFLLCSHGRAEQSNLNAVMKSWGKRKSFHPASDCTYHFVLPY